MTMVERKNAQGTNPHEWRALIGWRGLLPSADWLEGRGAD